MDSKNDQFKALPLRFSSTTTGFHHIYVKEHSVRNLDESKPTGRTLFILNVPPYATETNLKNVFSPLGQVENIIFQFEDKKQLRGFKKCYVVFNKRESLLKALKVNNLAPLTTEESPVKIGLDHWIEKYNKSIFNPTDLQKEISLFMSNFEMKEGVDRLKEKEEAVDDEGWTVVTKKGRTPGVTRKESVENKLNDKVSKQRKKKELKNFYTFQIRENKMMNIIALRKSFEEAKSKVQLMKTARKFKPF